MKRHLLALLFVPSLAWAASPEWCGDGIDDPLATGGAANGTKGSCPANYIDAEIGNGCDRLCTGSVDEDGDGYTTDTTVGDSGSGRKDCDDHDRRVIPDEYVPNSFSSPTGYKLCDGATGTYGATTLNATTPLCEATGGAHCYYVSASGSDAANNCQTYGSPCGTLGKLGGGGGGSPPAGAITLAAGDFVYILGSSNLTTQYADASGTQVLLVLKSNGTAGHPITLKRYPGATASLATVGGEVLSNVSTGTQLSYWKFYDLDITNGTGAGKPPVHIAGGDHLEFSRVYVHDAGLNGNNNDHCIYLNTTHDTNIHNSYFSACSLQTGNVQNIGAILWLDDHTNAGAGANHELHTSTMWWASPNSAANGRCIREKHGVWLSDTGNNGHIVKRITCLNPAETVLWNSSGLRLMNSRFFCDDSSCNQAYFEPGDASGKMQDNEITHNTFYGTDLAVWRLLTYDGTEGLTLTYNCVKSNTTYPNNGNWYIATQAYDGGAAGASAANKTVFEASRYLSTDRNIYYNASNSAEFSYFSSAPANGSATNFLSLANWKALSPGYDANSYEETISLSSVSECSSVHSSGIGALNTVSSTTTTTTTTTTLPGSPGFPSIFPQN